ncbi:glutamate [NMDA] receptor subunit 1-like [Homarus americanus]|uniref:Glutamate receptor-like 42 n=1 Tax=Homarus americanus TaxID=6706 RepID=A0A8J5KF90_HOMAM|nr:glutamate [NMDA] receptor subunit 1-like [Homarus americanus]KAG7171101.1 Glutamate receptor-like 42 [Homarus americanus]
MGHQFRVSAKSYFPYFSFERASEDSGNTEIFIQDSLNTRMIHTMAPLLNFTYDIREPLDRQWGVPGEGDNFTGIVGELQHQQADFSLDLTVTPQRAAVVQYCRVYIDESVIIMSSKPRPLPEYLSLIRPFTGELWLILLVSIFVWGATLWLLQKVWSWASGGRSFTLSSALFYSWGIILEDPPADPPNNITAQILVGWWLVFCLVMTSAYRSSLISHLVVQGKSPLINSVNDLVRREGWRWGTPRMTGALLLYLNSSPDRAIQKMYQGMQADSLVKGMEMVLEGGYSFIFSKYYSRTMVATSYTDKLGYTPIHISATEYPLFAGNAWAFRKGAPFLRRLDLAIQRLLEAGLITFWMDGVIFTRVRDTRRQQREEEAGKNQDNGNNVIYQEDDGQVVLGLHHLQVTFYLLMLGYGLGLLALLLEYLFYTLY